MSSKLHIVSLEMPYPPDYGGVMGIFNRIKAIHENGVEVHLHVFYSDRQPDPKLNEYCSFLHYYRRDMRKSLLFSNYPFIVASRNSPLLLKNLKEVDAPILFEGLHTCLYLNHPSLAQRTRLVRMHNIEHEYYEHLSLAEKNRFKKWYLKRESKKLKKFESVLKGSDRILAVVESDQEYFKKTYGHSELIPVFINNERFQFDEKQVSQVLYHGNLSVSENYLAADWLIENVFSKIDYSCIIAGKQPPSFLIEKAKLYSNITIIANPSEEKLNIYVQQSSICILPTFQATGIKLKLIDSLMQGKHCLVNQNMLHGTPLRDLCMVGETPEDFIKLIKENIDSVFSKNDFESRKKLIQNYFNNTRSVARIRELSGI